MGLAPNHHLPLAAVHAVTIARHNPASDADLALAAYCQPGGIGFGRLPFCEAGVDAEPYLPLAGYGSTRGALMKVPKMTTTQTCHYRGYDIVPTRLWSSWCVGVYRTRADIPLMARSTLSTFAPLMEEAVDEAKQSIDRALDIRCPEQRN